MAKLLSYRNLCVALGAAAAILAGGAGQALAASGAFPKSVTFVVGGRAGGGFDRYTRFIVPYLESELPGRPSIVVKTMPGAGGVRSVSWLFKAAPKDGSVIATMPAAAIFAPLMGLRGATYDPTKLGWLISLSRTINVLSVWHTTPFHSPKDVFAKQIIIGNVSGPSVVVPAMLNRIVHTKFKIVTGYPGTTDVALAMERGEVQGTINLAWDSLKSTRANWLRDKKVRLLMQVTVDPIPELKGVPVIAKYAKDEESRGILEILFAKQIVGRAAVSPPGTPEAIDVTYRKAFEKIVADPAFLAKAKKAHISISPTTGAKLKAFVKRIYALPKKTVDRTRAEMKRVMAGFPELKKKRKHRKKRKSN